MFLVEVGEVSFVCATKVVYFGGLYLLLQIKLKLKLI